MILTMNRSTNHVTCLRFAIWDQLLMHQIMKSHHTLLVDSTERQKSFSVCHMILPLIFGRLDAHSTNSIPVRFYLQDEPTTRCSDRSWIVGVNSQPKCWSGLNSLTSISMSWPILEASNKISLLERYVLSNQFIGRSSRWTGACHERGRLHICAPNMTLSPPQNPQIANAILLTWFFRAGHHQDLIVRQTIARSTNPPPLGLEGSDGGRGQGVNSFRRFAGSMFGAEPGEEMHAGGSSETSVYPEDFSGMKSGGGKI